MLDKIFSCSISHSNSPTKTNDSTIINNAGVNMAIAVLCRVHRASSGKCVVNTDCVSVLICGLMSA